MPDALVSAQNISITKGQRRILDEVSLQVALGEIVTLIGPNGAGKTTLVRALLGLERTDTGQIVHADGLTTGYVPQRLTIDRTLPLTVDRLMRINTASSKDERDAALGSVGLHDHAGRSVHALSGGERQRVLLARALVRRPNLLVLDEPTQNVDVNGAAELYRLIADIRERTGCGVLLVSHDLHVVMAATDHVYCLHHHICCSGKPEAVRTDPAFAQLFGPTASQTLALYTHSHDHEHDASGGVTHSDGPARDHHHG